ncbi:MAG: membrane dipeptidase [Alphaproteobacteria bacterium]|nr:membrane dipeptidase [Alphaproteobacteria bacterium]
MSQADRARDLYAEALVWDAHSCLPLAPGIDVGVLARHRASGVSYVSINVGMDFNPLAQCIRVLAAFRGWIARHGDDVVLAGSVADVLAAKRAGKLAVSFDLEGSDMIEGDLDMLRLYRDLGVRQIHFAYNRDNKVAGGCHGADIGLTPFGKLVVAAVNDLGLIMDCSHTGHRSSLDIMAASRKPVVFSHTCVRALQEHPRNVRDDQIDACARTGGVVGITGIGLFLGQNRVETELYARHIDYVAQRVGAAHAGFGLDFEFLTSASDTPPGFEPTAWWPPEHYRGRGLGASKFVQPEQIRDLPEALLRLGYSDADILGVLGKNFLRVAEATWGP